jgi:hypothetical protein
MFIARSSGRVRFARTAFLLAGLLPCAILVGWAVHLRSTPHRESVRRGWERGLGLPVGLEAVEHVRPGTVRARGCTLAAADGAGLFRVPVVEVETAADEVRIKVDSLDCDPAGARLLGALAAEWLQRSARFHRDCVVEIGAASWRVAGVASTASPMRVECVALGNARAVRVVRTAEDGGRDEVRIVRTTGVDAAAGTVFEVEAGCREPLPCDIVAAVAAGTPLASIALGPAATVRGGFSATCGDRGWAGSARGRVNDADLAACTSALAGSGSGSVNFTIGSLAWDAGRLVDCEFEFEAQGGRVDRRLLDALVSVVGCRPGPAFGGAADAATKAFDRAGGKVRIDAAGVQVSGAPDLGGALAVAANGVLVDPPAMPVSAERVAWLLAPPGAVHVPSAGAGAWLMSILPPSGGGARERTSQAGSPAGSREF